MIRAVVAAAAVFWAVSVFGAEAKKPEFLSGDAAKAALVDDSLEPYFAKLEPNEMTVKTGSPITGDDHDAMVAECKKRYQAGVLEFTDEEKELVNWYLDQWQDRVAKTYPEFGKLPYSFIKVSDKIESDRAHSRGVHIVLPEGALKHLKDMKKWYGGNAGSSGAMLILQEQTHVMQRLHPDWFEPLYTEQFHMIHAKAVAPSRWLKDRQYIMPDGITADWLFESTDGRGKTIYLLPMTVFTDPEAASMDQVREVAVRVVRKGDTYYAVKNADGEIITKPLSECVDYQKTIGQVSDDYHPSEVAADWFARLVVYDLLADKGEIEEKTTHKQRSRFESDLRPIRTWAAETFGGK